MVSLAVGYVAALSTIMFSLPLESVSTKLQLDSHCTVVVRFACYCCCDRIGFLDWLFLVSCLPFLRLPTDRRRVPRTYVQNTKTRPYVHRSIDATDAPIPVEYCAEYCANQLIYACWLSG